ncbi:ribbon-helix-helix domain-containing protein [Thermoflexus sp.]|uniref:ribbon-helix-helix domain-containing protein n=1 Tax=Thermoflexus sp. TaxID=1969742 RepID=UPI0035E4351C
MIRTQIRLEEAQYRALKKLAARQQVSVAELIRQAVREWLEKSGAVSEEERRQRAIAVAGRFRSGLRDLAEKHDKYLAQIYHGEAHPR